MSMAVAAQPSRMASSGMAPPPAKGSSTRGARPPCAARISLRSRAMSGSFSRPQWRIPPSVASLFLSTMRPPTRLRSTVSTTRPPMRSSNRFRACGVPGSGSSAAISAARAAASGRRAGHMCSVEICPCRTFFSCTESSDACLSGKVASMRRRSVMGRGRGRRPARSSTSSPGGGPSSHFAPSNNSLIFAASFLESSNWSHTCSIVRPPTGRPCAMPCRDLTTLLTLSATRP